MVSDEKTIYRRSIELREEYSRYWRPRHEAMDELESFLAGDRHKDDHGAFNRDKRLVQIKGQETQDTIRHIAAKATEKPRSIESRPRDNDLDPDTGELAASLCESETTNPWKGFQRYYEGAIIDARSIRLGIMWMDWDPDCGPFGEILFSRKDPRNIMWDPAYEDPHHPLCELLIDKVRIDAKKAAKQFKAPWIRPDSECFSPSGERKTDVPLIVGANGEHLPEPTSIADGKATLWRFWYKNDTSRSNAKSVEGTEQELEPGERYMSCQGGQGCGYRSPTQDEQGIELPEVDSLDPMTGMGGCPTCKGDLQRIDAQEQEQTVLAYSKGRRLVIIAPFSPQPDEDKPPYDGPWPIPEARSFPGLFITAYQKPGEQCGPCDTDLMWYQQLASDQLATLAVQRVFEHRDYWLLPRSGIVGPDNKRFNFRDNQFNIMYRDGTVAEQFDTKVEHFNGTGLDPSWQIAYGAVQAALTQYRGISDIGPIEENKDQSGIALQTRNAIGEIPVAHFNRRKNEALGMFYGILWDYIRKTYTAARIARLNIEGTDMLAKLEGDDMANFDFVIEDTPDFTGLDKAKSEAFPAMMAAFQQAAQIGIDPIAAVQLYAELNNLPRSIVRKFVKMLEQAAAKAEEAALQAEMAAASGMDPGMGAPLAEEEMLGMGLNGADMGSAPVA